jgi:hypothetical protein
MGTSVRLPSVILLSDDVENRRRAEKEGIIALSGMASSVLHSPDILMCLSPVRQYVSGTRDASKLLDVVASTDDAAEIGKTSTSGRPVLYPDVSWSVHAVLNSCALN